MDYNYSSNQDNQSNNENKLESAAPKNTPGPPIDVVKEDIPANPLLPKLLYPEWRQPVNCPLDGVRFV